MYAITQGSGALSVNDSLVVNLTAQPFADVVSAEILAFGTLRGEPVIVRAAAPGPFLAVEGGAYVVVPNGTADGGIAGAGLAARLGLSVGGFVSLVGSTSPRIEVVPIVGTFDSPGAAQDELVIGYGLGRALTGVGASSYHAVRVRTSDPAALHAFLRDAEASVHVTSPDGSRLDIRSEPPSGEDRLTNLILRSGRGTLSADALTTAVEDATNSIRVVASGLAALIGAMIACVVHAVQTRAFADRSGTVGALRAVGASNGWMRRRILLESVGMALAAGVAGAAISALVDVATRPLTPIVLFGHAVRPAFDLATFAAVVAGMCAVSAGSALLLVERAIRMRPSESIREGADRERPPSLEVVLRG